MSKDKVNTGEAETIKVEAMRKVNETNEYINETTNALNDYVQKLDKYFKEGGRKNMSDFKPMSDEERMRKIIGWYGTFLQQVKEKVDITKQISLSLTMKKMGVSDKGT